MAYLVLARKYRPELFSDMIGQEHITRTLANAINSDRLHHAYLFCGVRGLGKTSAARILAKCLVCETGSTPTPCNKCSECEGVRTGRSVDVIEIDGASNNSVDDIRSLRDQVHYLPQSARRKIYIIDEVHMLTASAFNALLKTLEEPPPHVTFLFATTEPHKVLPTILSRVSRLDFRPVTTEVLLPHLQKILKQEEAFVEEEGLRIICQSADQSIRDSLTLLDKTISFANDVTHITVDEVQTILGQADRFAIADLAQAVFDRDADKTLSTFHELCKRAHNLPRLAVSFLQHLRDLAVLKACRSRAGLLDVSDALASRLEEQLKTVNSTLLSQHFDRFSSVVDSLESSRAPRLAIEMALLDLVHSDPMVPLSDIVTQLNILSQGGSAPPSSSSSSPKGAQSGLAQRENSRRTETNPGQGATANAPRQTTSSPTASSPTNSTPNNSPPTKSPPHGSDAHAQEEASTHAGSSQSGSQSPPHRQTNSASSSPPPIRQANTPANIQARGPAQPSSPSPGPAPGTSPTPPEQPREEAPMPNSPFANQLWAMLKNEGAVKSDHPDSMPQAAPQPPPSAPDNQSNATSQSAPEQGSSPFKGGCPGSRRTPLEAIQWRTMQPIDAWRKFLLRVLDEDELLYAILSELGLSRIQEGVLELAAPSNGFARTQLNQDPAARARLSEMLARDLGESFEIKLLDAVASLPELPSISLLNKKIKDDHLAGVTQEANVHPQILSLVKEFSGKIRTVTPLKPPDPNAEASTSTLPTSELTS